MNRFTDQIDAVDYENQLFFHSLEMILFNGQNYKFWNETCQTIVGDDYESLAPLFCSLIANMSDEDITEYINSFKD